MVVVAGGGGRGGGSSSLPHGTAGGDVGEASVGRGGLAAHDSSAL